jgi:hypothetical protein
MGGFLELPKPARAASAAPVTASVTRPNLMKLERDQRLEALERRRRGRAGTIATSSRGLLTTANWSSEQKTLLGE